MNRIAEACTETYILENYRAFQRARRSLHRFPVELGPAGQFLFEGWLRLEEKSRLTIDRASRSYAAGKRMAEHDEPLGATLGAALRPGRTRSAELGHSRLIDQC